VKRWLEEPCLPDAGCGNSHSLRQQIAGRAEFVLGSRVLFAMTPLPFSTAIQQGLSAWVSTVAECGHVAGWRTEPALPDVVSLRLSDDDGQTLAALPIRLHQLEAMGMELLLTQLRQELGPEMRSGHERPC
jgi:hypothetical protein